MRGLVCSEKHLEGPGTGIPCVVFRKLIVLLCLDREDDRPCKVVRSRVEEAQKIFLFR